MKQQHHHHRMPSSRLPFLHLLAGVLAAGSVVPSASAATYSALLTVTGGNAIATDETPAGFTLANSSFGTGAGSVDLTAHGLVLGYQTLGTNSAEFWTITNVGDVTNSGNSVVLDRYLSFTLEPEVLDALAGYTGSYSVEIDGFNSTLRLDAGEHFEVRTSLDNFAAPLVQWSNAATDLPSFLSPGLTRSGPNVNAADGSFVSTDAPLEIRLYTWYDSPGGDGVPGWETGTTGNASLWRLSYTVTTHIPEPSALLLSLGAGVPVLLRRRRN